MFNKLPLRGPSLIRVGSELLTSVNLHPTYIVWISKGTVWPHFENLWNWLSVHKKLLFTYVIGTSLVQNKSYFKLYFVNVFLSSSVFFVWSIALAPTANLEETRTGLHFENKPLRHTVHCYTVSIWKALEIWEQCLFDTSSQLPPNLLGWRYYRGSQYRASSSAWSPSRHHWAAASSSESHQSLLWKRHHGIHRWVCVSSWLWIRRSLVWTHHHGSRWSACVSVSPCCVCGRERSTACPLIHPSRCPRGSLTAEGSRFLFLWSLPSLLSAALLLGMSLVFFFRHCQQ